MSTPFDHVTAIYEDQTTEYFDNLSEADKKAFSIYMVNRVISMCEDYIPLVDELQQYWEVLTPRATYLFYTNILPHGKHFSKYIKANKVNRHDNELISTVATHFGINTLQAEEYTDILFASELGKRELLFICEKYAIAPKQIRKFKI